MLFVQISPGGDSTVLRGEDASQNCTVLIKMFVVLYLCRHFIKN